MSPTAREASRNGNYLSPPNPPDHYYRAYRSHQENAGPEPTHVQVIRLDRTIVVCCGEFGRLIKLSAGKPIRELLGLNAFVTRRQLVILGCHCSRSIDFRIGQVSVIPLQGHSR